MEHLICPDNPNHVAFEGNAKVDQLWLVDQNGEYTSTIDECQQTITKPDRDAFVCHECGVLALWVPMVSEMRKTFVADRNDGVYKDMNGAQIFYADPTIQGFWSCVCTDDYVHRTDLQPFCYRCKTSCDDCSDARLSEIFYNLRVTPEELAAICAAVLQVYEPSMLK